MNVLFLTDSGSAQAPHRDGSVRYRCYHMAEALHRAGHLADVATLSTLELNNLSRYDVVSVHRPSASRKLLGVLERCAKWNIRTVADFDALLFNPLLAKQYVKETHPEADATKSSIAHYRAAFMRHNLAIQHFDHVSVATEELARARRVINPSQPVYVAPNGLSNYWLSHNDRLKQPKQTNESIGYFSSSRRMARDFTVAADALNTFLKTREKGNLNIIGPMSQSDTRIEPYFVKHGAWTDYNNMPSEIVKNWINIAPLVDSEISRAKPHTKFIESAAFGVPIICSPTVELDSHKVPGLHLATNTKEWLDALVALSDKQYRNKCQKQLSEYVRDCCMADHHVQVLVDNWNSANKTDVDVSEADSELAGSSRSSASATPAPTPTAKLTSASASASASGRNAVVKKSHSKTNKKKPIAVNSKTTAKKNSSATVTRKKKSSAVETSKKKTGAVGSNKKKSNADKTAKASKVSKNKAKVPATSKSKAKAKKKTAATKRKAEIAKPATAKQATAKQAAANKTTEKLASAKTLPANTATKKSVSPHAKATNSVTELSAVENNEHNGQSPNDQAKRRFRSTGPTLVKTDGEEPPASLSKLRKQRSATSNYDNQGADNNETDDNENSAPLSATGT